MKPNKMSRKARNAVRKAKSFFENELCTTIREDDTMFIRGSEVYDNYKEYQRNERQSDY